MSETSIDDLLTYEQEPSRKEREGSGARGWVRTALTAVALTAVTVFGLRVVGIGVSPVAVLAGFGALLILRRLTAQVAPPPPARARRNLGTDDGAYHWDPSDGLRSAVHRWQRKLHWAHGEPDRFVRAVQPMLADLVDERLRQRHGCTRAGDPAHAKFLLGEPLWTLLAGPPSRTPNPRQYAAILAKLEKL